MTANRKKTHKTVNLEITLEEALKGFSKNLQINFEIPCRCNILTRSECKNCYGYGYHKEVIADNFVFKPIFYNNQSVIYKSFYKDVDLIFKISVTANDSYKVKGKNIIINKNISIFKALCGGDISVDTPFGKEDLFLEEGRIADFIHIVEGKGLGPEGDLYIKFNIIPPKSLTTHQKQLLNNIIDENEKNSETQN
jgi:DnaJ-class molecular chaperone